jgi:hypothetical protein
MARAQRKVLMSASLPVQSAYVSFVWSLTKAWGPPAWDSRGSSDGDFVAVVNAGISCSTK